MVETWLTEVQRGQAIALLMEGQRQQLVVLQFGVNVSTIERLVRRLRDTGRVADRPRWGHPRKRVNCDSSVKKTRLHCLIGNCLGPCTANQAIRRT
jgi:transposase